MKLNTTTRKSIALACTLAAGAAMADTGVTLYGRANVSAENQKAGDRTESVLVDNQSRVGVRATRDIANGMTVGATLEAGINFTNGLSNASGFFAREATLALGGANFGQIKVGRMPASTAYFATADYVSNHNHDTGSSADALYDGSAIGQLKNAVSYATPKIGNLQMEAQYGFKNSTGVGASGNDVDSRNFSPVALSANYTVGALALGMGYERGENTWSKGDTTDYASQLALRAYYVMGPWGFGGYVQKTSGTDAGRTAYRLSAMYTMGQNEFHVNFGAAGERAGKANTGAKQFTLAYNYNLDKQTKLYALYTKVDNDSDASYNPGRFITNTSTNPDLSSVGVGVRYNF